MKPKVYLGDQITADTAFYDLRRNKLTSFPRVAAEFTVYDHEDKVVTWGLATLLPTNDFRATFAIPANAVPSPEGKPWTLTWYAEDDTKEYIQEERFEVVDPRCDLLDIRQQKLLGTRTTGVDLVLALPTKPIELSYMVSNVQDQILVDRVGLDPNSGAYNGLFVYTVHIPGSAFGVSDNRSLVTWTYRLGPATGIDLFVQQLVIVDTVTLALLTDLRMYLDKVLKPQELLLAYSDVALAEALIRGLEKLNLYVPPTTWSSQEIELKGLGYMRVLAGAWWALQVQFLAEMDCTFSYSGQSVSLDSDRTSMLSDALSKIETELQEFEHKKKNLVYSAVRPVLVVSNGGTGVGKITKRGLL